MSRVLLDGANRSSIEAILRLSPDVFGVRPKCFRVSKRFQSIFFHVCIVRTFRFFFYAQINFTDVTKGKRLSRVASLLRTRGSESVCKLARKITARRGAERSSRLISLHDSFCTLDRMKMPDALSTFRTLSTRFLWRRRP